MALTVDGLELELAGRELTGRPVTGRPRRSFGLLLLGLPAVLLGALLVVPIGVTCWDALHVRGGGLGWANVAAAVHAGGGGQAIRHTAAWIVVAFGLTVAAFGIALAGHRVPWLWRILQPALVVPFAVSGLVAGAAFRIVFAPAPEQGTVSALATALTGGSPVWLGRRLIWVVLVSAFAWMWLGFAVSLFRAGLQAIPDDVIRAVRAEGIRGWRRLRVVERPILRPITGIVVVTLVVAAVRLFDLVLVAAPGSVKPEVNVLSVQWWELTSSSGPADPGRPAALAVLLFAAVAVVALLGMRGLRRAWSMPEPIRQPVRPPPAGAAPPTRADGEPAAPTRRVRAVLVGVPVGLLWAFPVLILVATAFHQPAAAGLVGWWHPGGLGLDSFREASNAGLWHGLLVTCGVAGLATVLVVAVAVPTAYLLAWGGLPPLLRKVVSAAFVVLAVTPVQMYAAPLRDAFGAAGLGGSRIPLAFVHAAAGLPFGVLLLRAAFASAPPDLVVGALLGRLGPGRVLNQVQRAYRPALTAVAVLEFVLVWNDFIVGLLIAGPGSTTSSLVLWGEARQFATSAGTVAAAAVLSSVVPAALLLAFWSKVVRGLTVGTTP